MKNSETDRILIIGIGNDGREDDGLAWRILEFLENTENDVEIEYRFQLQIEDAELISHFRKVVFVDASKEELAEGYAFYPLKPSFAHSFSTHAIPPSRILGLCKDLYGKNPTTFMLAISGKNWTLKQGLSHTAERNLQKAWTYFNKELKNLKSHQLQIGD